MNALARAMTLALVLAGLAIMPSARAAQAHTARQYQRASHELLEAGRRAMAHGDYARALKRFEESLVADPSNAAAMVAIGRAHEALGQRQAARVYYAQALAIEPDNLPALEAEALAALAAGERDKALETLKLIQELCAPGGCPEQARVATALREADEREKADAAADRATTNEPRDATDADDDGRTGDEAGGKGGRNDPDH